MDGQKLTVRRYRSLQQTRRIKGLTKRRSKAMVLGLIYVLSWIGFCWSNHAEIYHSLIAGTLIALPALVWAVCALRGKNKQPPRATLHRSGDQILVGGNHLRGKYLRATGQISDEEPNSLADLILRRNRELIDKFLDIAERKVSLLDAYGDEKWSALPGEILLCMKKLALREGRAINWSAHSKAKRTIKESSGFLSKHPSDTSFELEFPREYRIIETKLEHLFKDYHERRKARLLEEIDIDALSGVEFQSHVGAVLRSSGYAVIGTPISGDQGGDLIIKKSSNTYIIQTKRSERPVGNKAVQEALSAGSYYGANQAWV